MRIDRDAAGLALGAHSHVTGPVEFIDGVPVFYSMVDLMFDLPRFEATEEGVLVELTFHVAELTPVELHPTVIVARWCTCWSVMPKGRSSCVPSVSHPGASTQTSRLHDLLMRP